MPKTNNIKNILKMVILKQRALKMKMVRKQESGKRIIRMDNYGNY